jgi:hypothetical protein
MIVAGSIKAQLDEAAHVMRQQMARIAELEAEVERLKAGLGAHEVLKQLYLNEALPSGTRLKAAAAAVNFEKPRLESVPPPLDLVAEAEVIPLADLVTQRRARQDQLEPPHRILADGTVALLKGNGSSGDDKD